MGVGFHTDAISPMWKSATTFGGISDPALLQNETEHGPPASGGPTFRLRELHCVALQLRHSRGLKLSSSSQDAPPQPEHARSPFSPVENHGSWLEAAGKSRISTASVLGRLFAGGAAIGWWWRWWWQWHLRV